MSYLDKEFHKALYQGKVLPYEQELIDNLRDHTAYGLPCSVILLSYPCCRRECNTMSILLSMGLDSFTLVRGNVNKFSKNDGFHNHSWVEKNGFVYDTTDGFKWEKETYYRLFEAEIVSTYDEVSLLQDSFYQELQETIKQELPSKEALAIELQYLELLEQEKPTINHTHLLAEIEVCRKTQGITTRCPKDVLKRYRKLMDENFKKD